MCPGLRAAGLVDMCLHSPLLHLLWMTTRCQSIDFEHQSEAVKSCEEGTKKSILVCEKNSPLHKVCTFLLSKVVAVCALWKATEMVENCPRHVNFTVCVDDSSGFYSSAEVSEEFSKRNMWKRSHRSAGAARNWSICSVSRISWHWLQCRDIWAAFCASVVTLASHVSSSKDKTSDVQTCQVPCPTAVGDAWVVERLGLVRKSSSSSSMLEAAVTNEGLGRSSKAFWVTKLWWNWIMV